MSENGLDVGPGCGRIEPMRLIESPLLAGFAHGFTTRSGGASRPPFDTLNLGGKVGDDAGLVRENWRRLGEGTGLSFARVRQVHGARAVRIDVPSDPVEEADVVVSSTPGVAACVSVADCVPVLIADPESGVVAAVHAGWRGTLARAAAEGVAAISREAGAPPGRLLASVGPSIGPCCYEVSPGLAARFAEAFGRGVVRDGGAPKLDLWSANAAALTAAGVAPGRVEVLGRCTACERDLFFSHRRDAGRTGRQVAFIAPRAPTSGGCLP